MSLEDLNKLGRPIFDGLSKTLDSLCPKEDDLMDYWDCRAMSRVEVKAEEGESPSVEVWLDSGHYQFKPVDDEHYGLYKISMRSGGCSGPDWRHEELVKSLPLRYDKYEWLNPTLFAPGASYRKVEFKEDAVCSTQNDCFNVEDYVKDKPLSDVQAQLTCLDSGKSISAKTDENGEVRFADHYEYADLKNCADKQVRFSLTEFFSTQLRTDHFMNPDYAECVEEQPNLSAVTIPLMRVPPLTENMALTDQLIPQVALIASNMRVGDPMVLRLAAKNLSPESQVTLKVTKFEWVFEPEFGPRSIEVLSYDLPPEDIPQGELRELFIENNFEADHYVVQVSIVTPNNVTMELSDGFDAFDQIDEGLCQPYSPGADVLQAYKRFNFVVIGEGAEQEYMFNALLDGPLAVCNFLPFKGYCDAGLIQVFSSEYREEFVNDKGEFDWEPYEKDISCPNRNQIYFLPTKNDEPYSTCMADNTLGVYGYKTRAINYWALNPVKCAELGYKEDTCRLAGSPVVFLHELGHALGLPHTSRCEIGMERCIGSEAFRLYDPISIEALYATSHMTQWRDLSYVPNKPDIANRCVLEPTKNWQLKCTMSDGVKDDCTNNAPWLDNPIWDRDLSTFLYADPSCEWGFDLLLNVATPNPGVMSYNNARNFDAILADKIQELGAETFFYPYSPPHAQIVCGYLISMTQKNLPDCQHILVD